MTRKRLFETLALYFQGGATKRADYLRKHNVFGLIGKNVRYQSRVIPLYPKLIKLHDNVYIARDVHFETHDTIHIVINTKYPDIKVPEYVGCIEVMDNVFVGSESTILYGVKIGENCIIGSGSLVNKDCEPNSVYAGVPAKRIGDWDSFIEKRMKKDYSSVKRNQYITDDEIKQAWAIFENRHNQSG